MKEQFIHLGFEIGTGKPISVEETHLVVTGLTQKSGKTTTLEGLINRSGLRAIAFRTKKGEQSFTSGITIPPFFRDRSDYDFVKSLIEAYSKEKLFIEKGTLMKLCKGSASILEIKKRVDSEILGDEQTKRKAATGLREEILIRLQHYLEDIIPQIQYANLSKTLNLVDGINIMNLENFSEEAQSLVIQSVADEVLNHWTKTILIIPEAWKFIPQKYNNPCKRIVESFVRQGAANRNFIWIDSQDMAGVDKIPLKSVATWILGLQSERNEVKHTLDQIPIPKKNKPLEDEVMQLQKGHFFVCSPDQYAKVYVQPVWLDDEKAIEIAMGKLSVKDIHVPLSALLPAIPMVKVEEPKARALQDLEAIRKEFLQLRKDCLEGIDHLTQYVKTLSNTISSISSMPTTRDQSSQIDTEEIILKVKNSMPNVQLMIDSSLKEAIARLPKNGSATYTVEPLKALQTKMQQEAKERICEKINALTAQEKQVLKFVEAGQKGMTRQQLVEQGLGLKVGGGNYDRVLEISKKLQSEGVARRDDKRAILYPGLKDTITLELSTVGEAKEEEIDQVYKHIIAEML